MKHVPTSQFGYITLLAVLVVGAVGVATVTSLLLLGTDASRTSLALQHSATARALAHGCVEEALQEIHDDKNYDGTVTLPFTQGSCTYTVTRNGGENRTIISSGTVGNIVWKVQVMVDTIEPQINVTSWNDVADFN